MKYGGNNAEYIGVNYIQIGMNLQRFTHAIDTPMLPPGVSQVPFLAVEF